jgi:WD40 repeat protein
VAFSPDGKYLATAGGNIDLASPDVGFSDGKYLANSSVDIANGDARIIAVADGRELARFTHDGGVSAVAFSPDGKYLATMSEKTAHLWSTALDDMLHQLCTSHGRNLSLGEWRRYLGDLSWQPTCENWPTPED